MKKVWGLFSVLILSFFTTAQTVEFQVDMGVQVYKGLFNLSTDAVKIAGNFNDWNNGADVLTDFDGDTIYTITKTFTIGDTLVFKFIKGTDGWELDPNREYVVTAGNTAYSDYFDRDDLYRLTSAVQIVFACEMEYEIVSGYFNPATDTLSLRGNFNGWSDQWVMIPTAEPTVYAITKTFITYAGEVFNYKFAYKTNSGTIWENDPNSTFIVTDADISQGTALVIRLFNYLIGPGAYPPSKIKFIVDMNGAVSSINSQPFSSITDVRLCGDKIPLRWPTSGWPNADSLFALKLFDDGTNGDIVAGDNIWSKDIKFPLNEYKRVQYKYSANWGLPTNNGGNENESSSGTYHYFDILPNILRATVVDTFGIMGEHPLTDPVILDVESEDLGLISFYSLEQNYPNPFNPSTKIKYSIPHSARPLLGGARGGLVTLKVYDILGNEVAELVNEYKPAGVYEVEFNVSSGSRALASGIYFYQLKTNNFVISKKMILLK